MLTRSVGGVVFPTAVKVAAHLIGLTTTGLTLALASRTNTDIDEDPKVLETLFQTQFWS
jgi:hypothetical protein